MLRKYFFGLGRRIYETLKVIYEDSESSDEEDYRRSCVILVPQDDLENPSEVQYQLAFDTQCIGMNLVNLSILNDNPTLTPNKIQEGLGIFVPGPDRRKVFVTETVTISFRLKDKSVAKRGVFPTTGVTYTETFGIVESLGVDFILGAEWINDEDILRGWRSLFSLPAASRVSRIAVAPSGPARRTQATTKAAIRKATRAEQEKQRQLQLQQKQQLAQQP